MSFVLAVGVASLVLTLLVVLLARLDSIKIQGRSGRIDAS